MAVFYDIKPQQHITSNLPGIRIQRQERHDVRGSMVQTSAIPHLERDAWNWSRKHHFIDNKEFLSKTRRFSIS